MTQRFLLGCIFLYAFQFALGQPKHLGLPPIINYSKQDYQAETQNWNIKEDIRGLLYFGNNKGLLEFDGTNWRTFSMPNQSIVRSIATDSLGKILVGGQDEIGFFQADKRGFLSYHSLADEIPEAYQNFEDVWDIYITEGGVIWASQKYVFLQKEEGFQVFTTPTRFDGTYYLGDKIYLSEFGEGIKIWQGESFQLIPKGSYFSQFEVIDIVSHTPGELLITTKDQGIFHYQEGKISPWAVELRDYFIENRIYCALKLHNGNLAIGTSHKGLVILDKQGSPSLIISKENGLQNNSVLSLHEDRSHNLWLGLENGISYIEISSPFSKINSVMGVEGTAYGSIVFEDKLYLATNQGVYVQSWKSPGNSLYPQKFTLVPNTRGPSWGLYNLDGNLIASQHNGAASISDRGAQSISPFNGSWKLLQLEKHPNYAIEGSYSGLLLYKREEGESSWTFKSKLNGFSESSRIIEQDAEGNIWISHPYRGVYKLNIDPISEQILSVKMYNSNDGFPSDLSINAVRIKQNILFTTPKGIYEYNKEQDNFFLHAGFERIFGKGEGINRLIEDENGTIWFATEEEFGILEIQDHMVDKEIRKLSFNVLRNRLVNGFEHIYAYDEQNIIIGIDDGFILYNPKESQDYNQTLPLYLREVSSTLGKDSLIFGGSFSEDGKILSRQPASQILTFQPGSHDLRFSFSAPFFEDINEVRYQYYLEGHDVDWSEWTNKTEKEYTNLSTGTHIFQVRAKNIYGRESDTLSYTFHVLPMWYETFWAKLLFFAMGIGVIVGFILLYRIRLRQKTEAIKQEQAYALEKKQEEFLLEVEKSEAEIIRLRNEKLENEVMHKNKELASSTMHLVQKGEILLKIKQQLERISEKASPEIRKQTRQISRMIDDDIRLDKNWKQFEYHFDQVHGQFLHHLRNKYTALTSKDQRLCAYLRMNLSTKEIAQLMNISVRGVEISRYRLRKKMNLDREVNLNAFMMAF